MDMQAIAIGVAVTCLAIALPALFILGGSRMTEQERIADDDAQMAAIKAHEEKKRLKAEKKAAKRKNKGKEEKGHGRP